MHATPICDTTEPTDTSHLIALVLTWTNQSSPPRPSLRLLCAVRVLFHIFSLSVPSPFCFIFPFYLRQTSFTCMRSDSCPTLFKLHTIPCSGPSLPRREIDQRHRHQGASDYHLSFSVLTFLVSSTVSPGTGSTLPSR